MFCFTGRAVRLYRASSPHGMPAGPAWWQLPPPMAEFTWRQFDGDVISASPTKASPETTSLQIRQQNCCRILPRGGTIEGEHDPRLTIVCCTDGKQDPCCARYGFATWKALRQAALLHVFGSCNPPILEGAVCRLHLCVLPQRARYMGFRNSLPALKAELLFLPAYRGTLP